MFLTRVSLTKKFRSPDDGVFGGMQKKRNDPHGLAQWVFLSLSLHSP